MGTPVRPCTHGELCRAYMKKFGLQKIAVYHPKPTITGAVYLKREWRYQACIYSTKCPDCPFYEPKGEK